VSVQPGGSVDIRASIVDGKVVANSPAGFTIDISTVGGISIVGSTGGGVFSVCGSIVHGSVSIQNVGSAFEVKLGDEDDDTCEFAQAVTVDGALSANNNAAEISVEAPPAQLSKFGGGLTVTGNTFETEILRSKFGAGGQVANNSGETKLEENQFAGVLTCSNNNPPPTGSGNTAARKTGQCAAL
jgi:hypothetical protein